MELEAEIDRLYGLPLDEFVGERGDLARAYRHDGDRETAELVAKLRKPTVGAWALNQAVRIRRSERDELLAAGERLRDAHEALMAGAGDADSLRAAMTDERALAAALADAAEAIATEAGRSGPALKERVRATLHAAAVDEEISAELAAGRIVKEREGVGLGPFALTPAAPATPRTTTKASPGEKRKAPQKKTVDAERKAEAARAKEAAAAERAAEAERRKRMKVAEQAVAAAHGALAEAKAAADEAAEIVENAKEALATAQAAEREARQMERDRTREVAKRERELEKLEG